MNGPFMFGVGRTRPSKRDAVTIGRIAAEHGATFIQVELPGTGYQHWFESRNRGEPFNRDRADRVYASLAAAGVQS